MNTMTRDEELSTAAESADVAAREETLTGGPRAAGQAREDAGVISGTSSAADKRSATGGATVEASSQPSGAGSSHTDAEVSAGSERTPALADDAEAEDIVSAGADEARDGYGHTFVNDGAMDDAVTVSERIASGVGSANATTGVTADDASDGDVAPAATNEVEARATSDSRPADSAVATRDSEPADSAVATRDEKWSGGTGVFGNFLFRHISTSAALIILATLAAVAVFLIAQAWPVLSDTAARFTVQGSNTPVSIWAFTLPQIFGTILAAALAMGMAVPLSIGIALFISHYAPAKLRTICGYLVDLLAAIPSVVYGLWGAIFLIPMLKPVWDWLNQNMGWFPLFSGEASPTGRVIASSAVILAVMVLPIITSVCREVFLQTPRLYEEAALAMGATRWEMVRMVVLPIGRSGIVSASMLGLGRALGETMAVVMVLSVGSSFSFGIFEAGQHSTIAANIALQFPEATGINRSALIATGLALFAITLVVNAIARWIVSRRAEFSGAN
ncbi:MAG: phosphate ABC transporter permease subunit PstC [Actinomycetaceae bacterium]|nr:phosphate ABC transporter permease subunit PstC [Actinomycetaceae bacterium]